MKKYIYIFLLTTMIFLAIDSAWIGFIAFPLYQKTIGSYLKDIQLLPVILFYFIYVVGMIYFVILTNLQISVRSKALFRGFMFGVICYATYDLTNMATLHGWTWRITMIDILWGGVACMITTSLVTYIFRRIEI